MAETSSDMRESLLADSPYSQLAQAGGAEEEESEVDLVVVGSSNDAAAGQGSTPDSAWYEAAAMFAMTVNYIFGAGVLSLPHQVAHGGIVASSLLLLVSSFFCLLCMQWVLETHERAKLKMGTHQPVVEYSKLCDMFLGAKMRRAYEIALTIYVICSGWMYAAIFSMSLARTLPVTSNSSSCDLSDLSGPLWNVKDKACWVDYLLYLALFTAMNAYLVTTDIGKMKNLQLLLTATGLTAVVTMIVTVAVAIPEDGLADLDSDTIYFNAGSFGSVFGTFVFAQLCHHGVPLLSSIPKRKKLVRPVFVAVISTTTTLYLVLGILCAIFFGVNENARNPMAVNKLISLNWQDYTAGLDHSGLFSSLVSYFIRLYPTVTVLAAFPLYAITLGNSWHVSWFGAGHENAIGGTHPPVKKTTFYLIAMMPSITFAAVMADISFMLFFVGVCAFVIAFFIPPALQLRSVQLCEPDLALNEYSTRFSRPVFCWACLVFAFVALIYTLYSQFSG